MAEQENRKARYSVTDTRRAREAIETARESNRSWADRRRDMRKASAGTDSWRRETHVLPRAEARNFTRAFLMKYPKAAYWSEVESWRVLEDDIIEFTLRRLPSAD